ncbi:unnamed protein product, partial [Didymodactylos carnosus]
MNWGIPEHLHGNSRRFYINNRRHIIKNHEYAIKYPPFKPDYWQGHFIDRTTTIRSLNEFIELAKTSESFIIDTEGTARKGFNNIPSLIQILLTTKEETSVVLIIEYCHLPKDNTMRFKKIEELMKTVLTSQRPIYVWGTLYELLDFMRICGRRWLDGRPYVHVQDEFQRYYIDNYDKQSNPDSWSLQDAMVVVEQSFLNKAPRKGRFTSGFNPRLFEDQSEELVQQKAEWATYAAMDILAVQR